MRNYVSILCLLVVLSFGVRTQAYAAATVTNPPWLPEMSLGRGLDVDMGELRAPAVEPADPSKKYEFSQNVEDIFDYKSYDTVEAVANERSTEANVKIGLLGFTGSFAYMNRQASSLLTHSAYVCIHRRVRKGYLSIKDPTLTAEAKTMQANPAQFRVRFGNQYLKLQEQGGEFDVFLQIRCRSEAQAKEVATKIGAGYYTSEVAVEINEKLARIAQFTEIEFRARILGGVTPTFPSSGPVDKPFAEQLFQAAETWSKSLRPDSVPGNGDGNLSGLTGIPDDYSTAAGWTAKPSLWTIQEQVQWQDLFVLWRDYSILVRDLRYMLDSAEEFHWSKAKTTPIDIRNAVLPKAEKDTFLLQATLLSASTNPGSPPSIPKVVPPGDIRKSLPARFIGNVPGMRVTLMLSQEDGSPPPPPVFQTLENVAYAKHVSEQTIFVRTGGDDEIWGNPCRVALTLYFGVYRDVTEKTATKQTTRGSFYPGEVLRFDMTAMCREIPSNYTTYYSHQAGYTPYGTQIWTAPPGLKIVDISEPISGFDSNVRANDAPQTFGSTGALESFSIQTDRNGNEDGFIRASNIRCRPITITLIHEEEIEEWQIGQTPLCK